MVCKKAYSFHPNDGLIWLILLSRCHISFWDSANHRQKLFNQEAPNTFKENYLSQTLNQYKPTVIFRATSCKRQITSLVQPLCLMNIPGGPKKTEPKKNALKRSKIRIIIGKFVNLGPDSVKFADQTFSSKHLFKRSESRFSWKVGFWLHPFAGPIR